jgi:hypothetical protein
MEINKRNAFNLILPLCLLIFIITMAACTKQSTDATLSSEPVVQSYLLPGQALTVKLYMQKALTDTAKYGQPITGLQVHVSDGSKTVLLTETSAGVYTDSDPTFLITGKTYSLQFQYLTFAVSAQTTIPSKPTNFAITDSAVYISTNKAGLNQAIDTLSKLTWSNPDSLNHVVVFNSLNGPDLAIGRISTTNASLEVNTDRKTYYYITDRTFAYYGIYNVTLLTVNQEYIDLLKSNSASATSQTLMNTYTNITNGFGIFTGMQAASNVLYLNVHPS